MMTRKGRVLASAVIATVCLLVSGTWLMAQTSNASVQGTVRDAQGAAVTDAQIVLTSTTKGDEATASTDARGNYTFAVVRADSYTLKISKPGFKTVEMKKVIVNPNDRFSAGVTTLEVSAQQETVEVVFRAPEIQAASGERSFTIENSTMKAIAANDRTIFSLISLVPGVKYGATSVGPGGFSVPNTLGSIMVNGARSNSNNMTIDGIGNVDNGDNGTNMVTTNLDTVAEFKVLTSSYQAEYGRAIGAQLQLVTKSGGNQFSGASYWYLRRNKWNANGWLNNLKGNKRDETAKRNDFGGNVGGPIVKKKAFFFASFERQLRKDPVGDTTARVPTLLEREGNFSASKVNDKDAFYIADYKSGLPCKEGDTRGCFQYQGKVGWIPPDRLYQPSLAVLKLYPEPNVFDQVGYNYKTQAPADQPRSEVLVRLDYHLSDNWRVMGRYMKNTEPNWLPLGVGWAAGGNIPMKGFRHLPGYNWGGTINGTLNSTTSLEINVGSAHNYQEIGSDEPLLFRNTTLPGIADIPLLYARPDDAAIPRFNWGGLFTNGATYFTQQMPFVNYVTTLDVVANLTKVAGAHVFKAGVYYQWSHKPQSPFGAFNGQISFANSSGQPYDTGHPFANAAIGAYQSFTQASRYAYPDYKYQNFEAFVQDNWKATRRLTLDYGVRVYMMTPQEDSATNLISNFLPDKWDAAKAPRLYTPVCLGVAKGQAGTCATSYVGMDPSLYNAGVVPNASNTVIQTYVGRIVKDASGNNTGDPGNGSYQAGGSQKLFSGSATRLSPRFGFTYDLNGRQTAILRGAVGIFYDRPEGNTRFNMSSNPPAVYSPSLGAGLLSLLDPKLTSTTPLPPSGSQPSEYNFTLPLMYAWNVGAQIKLPASLVWDISYVGQKGDKLLVRREINPVPYGAYFKDENQNPTKAPGTRGTTALPGDLLRQPYPGYGSINMWESTAVSRYDALQTTLNRRFDNGLMIGVSYTWSKTLGTVAGDWSGGRIDNKDREYLYGILGQDQPHAFTANLIYQTPKVAGGVMGVLVNSWQISGLFRYASGFAYSLGYSQFQNGTSTTSAVTGSDQAGRIVFLGDRGKGWSDDPFKQYDTSNLAPPQPGSIGIESAQNYYHWKPVQNLDASLSKSFPLKGRMKFELRFDAFNVFNKFNVFGTNNTAKFQSLTDYTITNLAERTDGTIRDVGGFGAVTQIWPQRQLQIVGRLTF